LEGEGKRSTYAERREPAICSSKKRGGVEIKRDHNLHKWAPKPLPRNYGRMTGPPCKDSGLRMVLRMEDQENFYDKRGKSKGFSLNLGLQKKS